MKHELSFLSSAQPRLLPRSGPHQTHMQHRVMALQFAPVCQNWATSRPSAGQINQNWPRSGPHFISISVVWIRPVLVYSVRSWPTPETKSAQIWQTELSGPGAITPRGVWAASTRLIQFWLNLLSLQSKILTSNILMFHLWATRGKTLRRGCITWNTSGTSQRVAVKRWTDFDPEHDVCWLQWRWFFMCSRQKVKVNNFLTLQWLVD